MSSIVKQRVQKKGKIKLLASCNVSNNVKLTVVTMSYYLSTKSVRFIINNGYKSMTSIALQKSTLDATTSHILLLDF